MHPLSSRLQQAARSGFSLIELVVVIAIISILISLTLFGVSAARESARRVQCTSNLNQMGIAAQSYASSHSGFPAFTRYDTQFWNGHSNHYIDLTPNLELQSVFETASRGNAGVSELLTNSPPSVFRCPSDPRNTKGTSYPVSRGISDYPTVDPLVDTQAPAIAARFGELVGPSGDEGVLNLTEIRDGLSNTVLYSERQIGGEELFKNWPMGRAGIDRRWIPNSINYRDHSLNPNRIGNLCTQLWEQDNTEWTRDSGSNWCSKRGNHHNHIFPPNYLVDDCISGGSWEVGVISARSFHRGGVVTAWCDGHTQFVSDSIDVDVWRAVGTRAGKQPEPVFVAD